MYSVHLKIIAYDIKTETAISVSTLTAICHYPPVTVHLPNRKLA